MLLRDKIYQVLYRPGMGTLRESSGGWIGSATRHFGWNIMVLLSVPSKSARQIGKR